MLLLWNKITTEDKTTTVLNIFVFEPKLVQSIVKKNN